MEDIGRPGTRNRRHGIDQPLVTQPFDLADAAEQRVRHLPLAGADAGAGGGGGDAALHRGRQIRHGTHDRPGIGQALGEIAQRLAGEDRDQKGARADQRLHRRRGSVEHLRLGRQHHDLGRGDRRWVDHHALFRSERRHGIADMRVDQGDPRPLHADTEPALEHGATHFACADEHEGLRKLAGHGRLSCRCRASFSGAAKRRPGNLLPETLGSSPSMTRNGGPRQAYASPTVSSMAPSSPSRALFPAQTTNWKAWK